MPCHKSMRGKNKKKRVKDDKHEISDGKKVGHEQKGRQDPGSAPYKGKGK